MPTFPPFETTLREAWYKRPALPFHIARSLWGGDRWPMIVRYRVLAFRGTSGKYTVSHIADSLEEARDWVYRLRNLGVGPPEVSGYTLRIRRSKLAPGHVLLRTKIRRFMLYYEPPQYADVIALLYRPDGRVKAFYEYGETRHFPSLQACLHRYRRDAAYLAGCETFHLEGV